MKRYFFEHIFLTDGWSDNVILTISDVGEILALEKNSSSSDAQDAIKGYAIPGIVNCHSHAFQRAMAGLSEYRVTEQDSFWSWRDLMYQFANKITPDDLFSIASYLYLEMLKAGYTHVAEFHYLHHQRGGKPYDNPAECSLVIAQAAIEAGIGLSLLPVLYQQGNFDGQALASKQLRFVHSLDDFLRLLEILEQRSNQTVNFNLGLAFHSLRAVPCASISEVINVAFSTCKEIPVHIHIAEQIKEVDDCVKFCGVRPVEWLMQNVTLDSRWCLIHATHLTANEVMAVAKSNATVGLCPTTEGNLGDGIFSLQDYLSGGGRFAIGSDSHVSISPVEELRWLEYCQRVMTHKRNVSSDKEINHCGEFLLKQVWEGGAQACKLKLGKIEIGYRADIIVLDEAASSLYAKADEFVLDSFIFNGNETIVRDVMVAGVWCVKNYFHEAEQKIRARFLKTIHSLQSDL